ncbi:MAG TPA: ATP-grasp domain-containing protein [Xanthomonadaceae bacterium]|jgi:hypothetical protein|nr:ATP-grasp domain-containing protein [Xanthomonadaceae bacterium]
MRSSVLILGGRAPVALDHARRFAAQGWTVHVADSISCRMSGWSRSVSRTLRLPSARDGIDAYASALNRLIAVYRIDLVVPTCEESFYLARIVERLPRGLRVVVGDFSTMRTLHSKWEFLGIASGCGAQIPESQRVDSIAQARDWAGDKPVVLKPEFSRFGVHVRLHPDRIPTDAPEFEVPGHWIVQRFHRGRELCSYSVADAGRLLAHVSYQPKYRLNTSSSYFFAPVESNPILTFVENLVLKTQYTGQISFDWIEGDDGQVTVLECNPRAISGVHLFSLEDALPAALDGSAPECIAANGADTRMLGTVMLFAGGFQAIRSRKIAAWWRDYKQAVDVVATADDRLPLVGGVVDLASYACLAMRNRCSLRQAATQDVEWNGQPMATL